MEGPNADIDRHEKRQGVNRQREDQPAEQTDANGVEYKSKGEHGGGSMCKGLTVAPSTTTAAQFWTQSRNLAELRHCNSTLVVRKAARRRLCAVAEFPDADAKA